MEEVSLLIQQAKGGDKEAFSALVRPLEKSAYHLVFSMVGNKHDAEDAWQDTVIKAWLNLRALRSPEGLRSWMCRIAINEANNILRRRHRQPLLVETWPEPIFADSQVDECLVVHGYLQELPLEQRAVLVMRFWLDMTIPEIAQAMHVPLSTAKSRLYLGMERLRTVAGKEVGQIAGSSN